MQQEKECVDEVRTLIQLEEKRLDIVLSRIKEKILSEFQSIKQHALSSKQHSSPNPTIDNLLSITLPFSDKSRRIREKLNNVLVYKQIMMNTQNQLSKDALLSKEEEKEAKMNFDLICNYKQREHSNQPGKTLYTVNVCKHLVKKTFKKTAHEVYETMASTELILDFREQVRIVCIGGGPGSDLCGIVSHLLELGIKRIRARVYDYNWDKWSGVAHKLGSLMVSESKKFQIELQLVIEWRFIDMTIDDSKELEEISEFQPQIVSCCWALNEDLFVKSFWSRVITGCREAYLVFLDGNRYPLETLLELKQSRKVQYCAFESPRSLLIYPSNH